MIDEPDRSIEKGADRGSGEAFERRLRWRCRRGMRELDRILEQFLAGGFAALAADEKRQFAEILELPDPELHAYLTGRAEAADPALARIFHAIRSAGSSQA